MWSWAASVQAHDTWIAPLSAGRDGETTVLLTSGMSFPAPESAIAPERLTRALARSTAGTRKLKTGTSEAHALLLSDPARPSGSTLYTVELKPRTLALEPAAVAEYLAELEADSAMRARYTAAGQWRERYSKSARALQQDANGSFDASFLKPEGDAFQLVLMQNPILVQVGDGVGICAWRHGKPVPGVRIGLVYANHTETPWWRSDADGCVVATVLAPGAILARSIDLRAVEGDPALDWESAFATYRFEVPHPPAAR